MTATRQVMGWLSWYVVSTVLYAIVWTQLDGDFRFALPAGVVLPLLDFLGTTSAEGTYDVYVWSTSIVAVACIHAAAWVVVRLMNPAMCGKEARWSSGLRLIFTVIGWISWLFVSTAAVILIYEAIYVTFGGTLANYGGELPLELLGWLAGVVVLHLVVLNVARCRKS